tara:strand:+ start:104 stop:421 length:318 start_codon:yes stop_codon:yes gene_type:complete
MAHTRTVFLVLALVGAVGPLYFMFGHMQANGFSLGGLFTAWGANMATRGLMLNMLLSSLVLTVWALIEAPARRDYLPLVAIPVAFYVGLSSGLPLYLFLRARPLN